MAVGAADILAAVARRRDELVELTCALVREQSTLGNEEGAQRIVAARLEAAGFSVDRVEPNAEEALADPRAGYPSLPYDGRSSVIGTLQGSGGGRSLHLSGHVDVVPIDAPGDWTYEPWAGTVADGRIWGRGAGDMKGGLAAYVIAAEALAETHGDRRGDLLFSSVFEEECGGNGMWSITRAGHVADATLLGEPTGLKLAHGGTGVVWARLAARGAAGHAFLGRRSGSFDLLSQAVARAAQGRRGR